MKECIAMLLAGGQGSRLYALTQTMAKPAVYFGGKYRIIDFPLSNCVNSGVDTVGVLTQYQPLELNEYLGNGQPWDLDRLYGGVHVLPPYQTAKGSNWYKGTADAIYQNLTFIEEQFPDDVCVFGSDHIYKMDIRQMLHFHTVNKADLTVAAIRMPSENAAGRFGIIEVDENGRMIGFEEKPEHPKTIPGDKGFALVSMGNYIFKTECLGEILEKDAKNLNSSHDFGKDIIPKLFPVDKVFVYDLATNHIGGEQSEVYWRDVGSVDAYWESHMDLVATHPPFKLFNPKWPLHTYYPPLPPAHYTDTADNHSLISQSLISAGCFINGATIRQSVLGFRCSADDGSEVVQSVLVGDVKIGARCKIRRAIIDRHVEFAPGFTLGYDHKKDLKLVSFDKTGPFISPKGIIVIPKGMRLGFDN